MDAHRIRGLQHLEPILISEPGILSGLRRLNNDKSPIITETKWTLGPLPTDQQELRLAVNIDKFRKAVLANYNESCKKLGIQNQNAVERALVEALNNSLIHGVLGLAKSEDFVLVMGKDSVERTEAITKIKLTKPTSAISVTMDLTSSRVVFTILDGGSMTPEVFETKWKHAKAITDAEELTAEQIEQIASQTSGRGFAYIADAFTSGRGIAGGVILTKEFEPVSPQ